MAGIKDLPLKFHPGATRCLIPYFDGAIFPVAGRMRYVPILLGSARTTKATGAALAHREPFLAIAPVDAGLAGTLAF